MANPARRADEDLGFDLSSGLPCLDFVNTLDGRADDRFEERLQDYRRLVAFARAARLLSLEEAATLGEMARLDAQGAADALATAKVVREACYRIFSALAAGRRTRDADLALLNRVLAKALSRARLVRAGDGFTWVWPRRGICFDRPLWALARGAADLLTSPEIGSVRVCASPSCEVLFVDSSRNRRRKWCDMRVCGNRAKARRHYERSRAGSRERR